MAGQTRRGNKPGAGGRRERYVGIQSCRGNTPGGTPCRVEDVGAVEHVAHTQYRRGTAGLDGFMRQGNHFINCQTTPGDKMAVTGNVRRAKMRVVHVCATLEKCCTERVHLYWVYVIMAIYR